MNKTGILFVILSTFLLVQACKTNKKVVETKVATQDTNATMLPADTTQQAKVLLSPFAKDDYRPTPTKYFDLEHTRLEVSFDWKNAYLLGKAELTLSPHFYSADKVILDAKGFDIHKIERIDGGKRIALQYDYDGLKTRIYLNEKISRKQTIQLFIDYTAKPNELGTVVRGGRAISDDKGLFFINPNGLLNMPKQIWTQGETESSSCWFPTIDAPNQKTTQEIFITVKKEFISLSNGKLISSIINKDGTRTDYWKQDQAHAPYLFMMAIGDFAKVTDSWRNIPVDYYVEPEYEPYAKEIFKNTKPMLDFFSEAFGVDYMWDKYAQIPVRQYVSGAMENTGAVIFGEYIQQTSRELMDENHERVIAHEMAHHWFGDLVTCESWSQLPLNESFATYGEYLWNEHAYGKEEAEYYFQITLNGYFAETQYKQKPLVRHHYGIPDDMFDSHSYNKGAWVLHTLRAYVGDDAFFSSLRLYLQENKFKAAEMDHLRLAFEEVTGEDLNWFFDQWFFASGHPDLKVRDSYNATTKEVTIRVEQLQDPKTTPIYRLPIAVDLYFANQETKRIQILIDRNLQEYKFTVEEKPILVNFDANKSLLARIDHEKTNDALEVQFYTAPHYLDKIEAIEALSKEDGKRSEAVMKKLMDEEFWYFRFYGITNFSPKGFETDTALYSDLKRFAREDKRSHVRYAAINKLGKMQFEEKKDFFFEIAKADSSLLVIDALLGVAEQDSIFTIKLASTFEKDTYITPYLTDLYATIADTSKCSFFPEAFAMAKGYKKWRVIENYTKFLLRFDVDFIANNIDFLIHQSQKHDMWWIRGATSESLATIYAAYTKESKTYSEEQKTKWMTLRTKIKATLETNFETETHLRLQSWYQKMANDL